MYFWCPELRPDLWSFSLMFYFKICSTVSQSEIFRSNFTYQGGVYILFHRYYFKRFKHPFYCLFFVCFVVFNRMTARQWKWCIRHPSFPLPSSMKQTVRWAMQKESINKYNKMACWLVRLCRISVFALNYIEFLLHVLNKDTKLSSWNIWIVPWADPGAALHWRGAQYADLSTQTSGGQQHRPWEGGALNGAVVNNSWAERWLNRGHPQLEKLLTYDKFMEWTRPDMMDVVEVQVGLPRFKLEEKFNMKSILVRMGMVEAFDVAMSNFSGNRLFPNGILRRKLTSRLWEMFSTPDRQACPQPTTSSCQKWFTKLLWMWTRREPKLLLLLALSWCSAVHFPLRDSMQTILSSSSSDITPQWAFCLLAGIVLPSDRRLPGLWYCAEVFYSLY